MCSRIDSQFNFPNVKPNTKNPVLHIPQIFNYEAIDGKIVEKEPGSKGEKE